MRWYLGAFSKYAVFSGRARRKEYWMYSLFCCMGLAMLAVLGVVGHTMIPYLVYLAVIVVPSLTMTVRRLHDSGTSGWFVLIALLPLFGSIILLVFACTEGDKGQNAYGPDPKREAGTHDVPMSGGNSPIHA
ncbi:DUF805 domain-containing protein [Streptomyces sp. NPDC049040]|uniref:DUF805 domain-containing protein n=1 Tax=Streptomyces sp. NPDC049040 TaxID=3365593 RepID=UPI003718FB0B